jgi:hypothetical protein
MPLSIEKIRYIAIFGTIAILLAAGAFIIYQYPEVLNPAEKPNLQIISRDVIQGRNAGGFDEVNATFTIVVKNTGTSNESKILVCSVTFQSGSSGWLTFHNRTTVTLLPGEVRTYHPIVNLPDSAKSVSWTLGTAFE